MALLISLAGHVHGPNGVAWHRPGTLAFPTFTYLANFVSMSPDGFSHKGFSDRDAMLCSIKLVKGGCQLIAAEVAFGFELDDGFFHPCRLALVACGRAGDGLDSVAMSLLGRVRSP